MKKTNQIIKEMLRTKGLTQKELALKSGITEAAMSHYIKGDRVPRGEILLRIAKALGTTTDELLEESAGNDISFEELSTLICRKQKELTPKQKKELINLLLD